MTATGNYTVPPQRGSKVRADRQYDLGLLKTDPQTGLYPPNAYRLTL